MKMSCGVLLLAVFFSGCTQFNATTTRFYPTEYRSVGTISVIATTAEVNDSLEFSYYKPRIGQKLASYGYTIVSNPSEAKYVALVAYGIDEGKSGIVSTPIFGQTGGGTTTFSSYGSSYYTMPTYGMVAMLFT